MIWMLLLTSLLSLTGCRGRTPPGTLDALVGQDTSATLSRNLGQPSEIIPPDMLRFVHLTSEDGLSESKVTAILQDTLGLMWFGTQDGLSVYDGRDFTIIKHDPADSTSLSQNSITALYEDSRGMIWVGTFTGGLNKYDRSNGAFTRYQHDEGEPDSLSGNQINAIFEDAEGNLWIGTDGAGLSRMLPESVTFVNYRNLPDDPTSLSHDKVFSVYQDRQGRLWVGTAVGLDLLDLKTGHFTHYQNRPNDPTSLPPFNVRVIFQDSRGKIWVGTDGGLSQFDPDTGQAVRYLPIADEPYEVSSSLIRSIVEDRAGAVWVATYGGGLSRYDPRSGIFYACQQDVFIPNSLNDNRILVLYVDRSGILWVGTNGGGVNRLDASYKYFYHYFYNPGDPFSLSYNIITAIAMDQSDGVWVGTDGGSLNRLDFSTGRATHYLGSSDRDGVLSDNQIKALYVSEDGIVWVGTTAGLNSFMPPSSWFTHYPIKVDDAGRPIYASITSIAGDAEGNLWLGTEGSGLLKFDRRVGEVVGYYNHVSNDPDSLSSNTVLTVFVDSFAQVWVGTAFGLDRLDRVSGRFTHYTNQPDDPQTLNDNTVFSIYEDRSGVIWVGSAGGLSKLDTASGIFTQYREKDGLPNEYVCAILEDDRGYLWMSTNRGLARFNPRSEMFRNYDMGDGLQGNEFMPGAAYQDESGQMFFGGINGLTVFYPDEIRDNPYVPSVALIGLSQGDTTYLTPTTAGTVQELTLRWPENGFEFSFAALSYSRPELNQQAYLLEGFDSAWNNLGTRRSAQYTNLPGGTYTLWLKGANNDGVWSPGTSALRVTVIPPFWSTWWFIGLLVMVTGAAVGGGVWLRVRGVESHSRELEALVNQRAREIESLFEQTKDLAVVEERNRLARDLHDSAKQKAFAALAQIGTAREIVRKSPVMAKDHLDEAENLVYEVIQELTFLIQEMYPITLQEKGLVNALREYIFEWEGRTGIPASLDVEGEHRLPLQMEQAFYRIVQEALANTARHSHATQVQLALRYRMNSVEVTIVDNGCGFDINQKPGGVGLRSMRERAAMIHGGIRIEAAPGRGTHVIAWAPIQEQDKKDAATWMEVL